VTSDAERPWSGHGGRLSAARRRYADAPGPWLDLSTGINPHPWPGAQQIAIDWRSLPDEEALALLEAVAARYFGINARRLCAVPGSEIGLRLLGDLLPGSAAHVAPSYRTHAEMISGSRPFAHGDVAASTARTVIVANPNNPDGKLFAPGDLSAVFASGRTLVVDEAFADAVPEASIADRVDDDRPLIIVRSFGKFFGLAGVRLGFVLGPQSLIDRLRAKLGSWPVSAAALAIGTDAYRDHDWIAAMRLRLREDAAALDDVLARHAYRPMGACPLFRLIETDDAAALFDRLAARAILTRPFDYAPRWLRIGLPGSAEALARLDRALADG